MQVLRSMVPKAFLKSRHATTCVGLSAKCAFKAVVIASPPWGGADAKLSISEKDFQVGLGRLQQKVAEKFGPKHAYQNRSDGPPSFVQVHQSVGSPQPSPPGGSFSGSGMGAKPL